MHEPGPEVRLMFERDRAILKTFADVEPETRPSLERIDRDKTVSLPDGIPAIERMR